MQSKENQNIEELTLKPMQIRKLAVRLNEETSALVEEVQKATGRSATEVVIGLIKRGYRGWVSDQTDSQKPQLQTKTSAQQTK